MAEVVRVKDLTVAFDGEPVVKDLNFVLDAGDALAVIGPNGAGKTMFLKALLGMVPHSGTIAWAKDTRVGYVPQKIDADRHLPVNFHNLLASKAAAMKVPHPDIGRITATVGLDKKTLATPVGHLSGGQFQRALIAFALLGKPNVLLLDEPTSSIDAAGETQIYELVHRLQDEYDMTVIAVSHDLSFVYRYATKVLCLNRSGLCFGPPDEALTPEILEKVYGPHKYYHHIHHKEDGGGAPAHDHEYA